MNAVRVTNSEMFYQRSFCYLFTKSYCLYHNVVYLCVTKTVMVKLLQKETSILLWKSVIVNKVHVYLFCTPERGSRQIRGPYIQDRGSV